MVGDEAESWWLTAGAGCRLVNVRRREVPSPVSYEEFRQRVRVFRRDATLREVAALSAAQTRAQFGQGEPLGLPNYVAEWSLAGVARTALITANDHRNATPTLGDLVRLCGLYVNVADPDLEEAPHDARLRGVLGRIAYEQFGFGYSLMENIGRTLTLLLDHAAACSGAPSAADWQAALGVPLEHFMRVGFGLHVAMLQNGGSIARATLVADNVMPVFAPLQPDELLRVVDRYFARTPLEHRDEGRRLEVAGFEKWSPNPLQSAPLVALGESLVGPSPRYVADRITPSGLYFIGLEAFGKSFPDALGCMFERYVGTQLRLLQYCVLYPEVAFGSPERRTVDYFLVTAEVVVLVEVKASRPVLATRIGDEAGDEDFISKIGRAREQILTTAGLLDAAHPALTHIPRDRPVVGLVVTLEPWHLAGTFVYDELLPDAPVQIVIASAHDVEGTVARLADRHDVGARLLDALAAVPPTAPSLRAAAEDLPTAPNAVLRECWDRFAPEGGHAPNG